MKNQNQYKQEKNWQGWPLSPRSKHSAWLDRNTNTFLGLLIVCGSGFSFICGVIVGVVQPPLYHWILKLIGLG